MIEVTGLIKRYEDTVAVDGLTFQVAAGQVTGFLGPNGAGKSTTMRLILGLDAPNAGTVTVNGTPYGQHRYPMHEVGALLDRSEAKTQREKHDNFTHWRGLNAPNLQFILKSLSPGRWTCQGKLFRKKVNR